MTEQSREANPFESPRAKGVGQDELATGRPSLIPLILSLCAPLAAIVFTYVILFIAIASTTKPQRSGFEDGGAYYRALQEREEQGWRYGVPVWWATMFAGVICAFWHIDQWHSHVRIVQSVIGVLLIGTYYLVVSALCVIGYAFRHG